MVRANAPGCAAASACTWMTRGSSAKSMSSLRTRSCHIVRKSASSCALATPARQRGISAGTYQHEVDHLHGMLFVDRVRDSKTLCTWQEFERHYKSAFVEQVQAIVARWGS